MKRRLFVFTMALLLTPAAPAATIPVDTLEDDDAVNGNCTLREAIGAANADKPVDACVAGRGNDRIDLRGLTGALNLTGALPGLSTGIEIAGPGAEALTIRRESGGNYRIFTVSANVAIEGLTLANGVSDEFGGGILNSGALRVSDSVIAHGSARRGGGIYNDAGTISLKKSEISDNVASDIRGGGIYNQSGTVAATDTVIRDNVAEGGGGGVYNKGNFNLTRGAVSNNGIKASESGGGILNEGGRMVLTDSTVKDNFTGRKSGGGIYNKTGDLTVINSLIGNNLAAGLKGGGLYNTGTATLVNSTVSGNQGAEEGGTGIYNGGDLTLINCTVAYNKTHRRSKSGLYNNGAATLVNTIVAHHRLRPHREREFDCAGKPIVSKGHNLDSDGSCGLNGPGDLPRADPLLAPLDDNGGPTFTHALQLNSPAIDAADSETCKAAPVRGIDQRGVVRGSGDPGAAQAGACDIGAFEFAH